MQPTRALVLSAVLVSLGAAPAGAAPLPASGTLDLSEATEQQASLITAKAGGFAGRSVANVGDFNGDGRGDVAISESEADTPGRSMSGLIHVLLEPKERGALASAAAVRIRGASAGDRAGFDVAPAGDVNGDKLADLLIGAPVAGQADGDAPNADGAVYLVLGRPGVAEIDLAAPDFGGMRISAPGERSWLGHSVAAIADVTGDGRRDLVIGAPKRDSAGRPDAGAVHVVSATLAGDVDLTKNVPAGAGFRVDGPASTAPGGALAGYAVDAVGDLNGDELGELLIGAPQAPSGPAGTRPNGAAYVVFGAPAPQVVDLESLGARGFAVLGRASAADERREGAGDWFGGAVAGLGDVTGDSIPDLAIGAHLADGPDRLRGGRVRIVPGGARTPTRQAGLSVVGVGAGDATGMAVAPAGDINADGLQDVAIGAPLADPLSRNDAGAAYVVFGARGNQTELDLAEFGTRALRIAGGTAEGTLGFSLAPAGDVDGDGGDDLAAGAPAYRAAAGFQPSVAGTGGLAVAFGASGAKDIPGADIKADPGYQEAIAEGCRPRTNVQAVLDDDDYNDKRADPTRMRLTGMQDYVATPRNFGTVLGVTGFGPGDDEEGTGTVLRPTLLSADNDVNVRLTLKAGITGEDSFPGYDTQFRTLADDNPAADARIMVIDGYTFRGVRKLEGLTKGAAPTYIVAVGEPPDRNKADIRQMKLVAKRTGARYYQTETAQQLRRALEAIESRLRCDVEVDRFQEELQAGEADEVADVEIDEDAYSADVMVSWDDGTDHFELDEIDVLDEDGDVVSEFDEDDIEEAEDLEPYEDEEELDEEEEDAEAGAAQAGAAPKAAIASARGRRFRSVHVTGLRPGGRLRVTVKAAKRKTRGRVVTRVTQSRRRG